MMTTSLTSREAIRERNEQMVRQSKINFKAQRKRMRARARRARADAPHVVVLQRELALCVEAQARAAVSAARTAFEAAEAAVKAACALQKLQAELRTSMRLEIGADFDTWHPNGFGDDYVALTENIATDAKRIADAAEDVEGHASDILKRAEVLLLAADNDNDNNADADAAADALVDNNNNSSGSSSSSSDELAENE
jgi:hypothetical protein